MYATIAEARAAGAVGTDDEVTAALAVAAELIDRYVGYPCEPRPASLVARYGADGTAVLPWPVVTVTGVRIIGASTDLDPTSYRVLSSRIVGQIDAVLLGTGGSGYDVLVAGAEPWNGGYTNLLGRAAGAQVSVSGTFGLEVTPAAVHDAALALAVWRTQGGRVVLTPGVPGTPGGVDTDDEGNVVSITTVSVDEVTAGRTRTTGLPQVDAVLAPYVRDLVRVN